MGPRRKSLFVSRAWRITVLLLFSSSVHGQTKDDFLVVKGARPVADAVVELMKRHPVVVTYEDPRYTYAGDLKDVTDEIRNPLAPPRRPDAPRVFVPVGGQIEVRYTVSTETNKPTDLRATLESVVQAKLAVPAGGHFRVEQSGSVFHVVASEVRDASGRWVAHTSVLDVPITLASGERSGSERVSAILDEVTATTGVKFALNDMALTNGISNGLPRYSGVTEANNEPAREVMVRALQGMNPRLTWLLYYDPMSKKYFFNVVMASAVPEPVEIHGEQPRLPRPGDPTPTGRPFRGPN